MHRLGRAAARSMRLVCLEASGMPGFLDAHSHAAQAGGICIPPQPPPSLFLDPLEISQERQFLKHYWKMFPNSYPKSPPGHYSQGQADPAGCRCCLSAPLAISHFRNHRILVKPENGLLCISGLERLCHYQSSARRTRRPRAD